MTAYQRGDGWQANFMVKGVRYREPFDTEHEATQWERDVRSALRLGQPIPPPSNQRNGYGTRLVTLGDAFDYAQREHWNNNPRIKAPETAIRAARQCVEFFGAKALLTSIDSDEMRRLVRHVVDSGLTYATADRRLAALSKMLRLAHEKGAINRLPKVPLSGETNESLRFLTADEAQRILQLWVDWDQEDMYAFTLVALHLGCRKGQLLDLRWSKFAPGHTAVLLDAKDKGSPIRTLPLSPSVRASLARMKALHPDERGPFMHLKRDGHLRTMWERMQAHLGYDDVVIHTLRHTCASWMVQKGIDLKRVQTWLGHKRIETTLIYAKLGTGDLDVCSDVLGQIMADAA